MEEDRLITVIVPEPMGLDALSDIDCVETVLVEPGGNIPADARDAEILVVGPAEKPEEVEAALKQIGQLPMLKLVQTLGQGTEQWDGRLPEGVELQTARGAHGGSAAEWVMMATLTLTRELPHYLDNQRKHSWEGHRTRTLQGADVLIYGASDLGRNVQRRLEPFGARATLVGSHARDGVIDTTTAYGLLPETDIVVIALPLTDKTRGLVDAEFLAQLPDGAIVVNVGRGGLVDQAALVEELRSGRLQAALDVTTPEPLPSDDPLWDMPGLILTPHVGGNTDGADERAWTVAAQRIREYIDL